MKIMLLLIAAQLGTGMTGIAGLTPFVTAEGEHLFNFAYKPPTQLLKKSGMTEDEWVDLSISRLLAENQWCLDGWEITERYPPASGILLVEGRCL